MAEAPVELLRVADCQARMQTLGYVPQVGPIIGPFHEEGAYRAQRFVEQKVEVERWARMRTGEAVGCWWIEARAAPNRYRSCASS